MQIFTHLTVDLLVLTPANDHLLDRDQLVHGVDTTNNLLSRIVRRMPSAQRYLNDIPSLLLLFLLMTGQQCHQSHKE